MKEALTKASVATFFLLTISAFTAPSITGYSVVNKGALLATNLFLFFKLQVFPRFIEMLSSPFTHPKTTWMIVPLLITIFFMQLYFGRWKNEKLGWNSAFANMIALLFITVGLLYQISIMYDLKDFFAWGTPMYKAIFVFFIILQIFLMMIFIFMHALPRGMSFFVSSPLTVYTIAFVAIVLVYGDIPIDLVTLVTFICLYIIVQLFFAGFRWLIPPSEQAEKYLERVEKKKRKIDGNKKRVRTLKRHLFVKNVKERVENIRLKLISFKDWLMFWR